MDTMDSVSFKAYLKRDGQDVEVRRFGVDGMVVTSLIYLRGKIQAIFPSIKNDQFSIYWQDSDMDTITIDSDEELVEALAASTSRPVKIFINSEKGQQGPSSGDGARLIHTGVTCDGCEGPVSGNRFMCLHCANFDLCAVCQATGKHPDHIMLRIPASLSESLGNKFSRKTLGRLQKFAHHVDRRMNRGGETSTGHFEDLFGCTRENVPQSGCPARAFLPISRDIITEKHKEMVEVLRALGVPGVVDFSQPQPGASATSGSGTQNQAGNASGFQANNYLGNVGQALAALLEPLDIPMRKKNKLTKKLLKKNAKAMKKHGKRSIGSKIYKPAHWVSHMTNQNNLRGSMLRSVPLHQAGDEALFERVSLPGHKHGGHGFKHGHHGPKHGFGPNPWHSHKHGFGPKHGHHSFKHGFGPKHGHHGSKHGFGLRHVPPTAFPNLQPLIIDLCADDIDGVAVTVDPRYKANQMQPAAAPVVTPTTPVVTPASPAPTAVPSPPSAAPASEPQSQPGPSAVRRNSDDWTLLNRESPNRHEEVAMDVDSSGASGRTPASVYPELPKEPASAPTQPRPDTDPQTERQIQEAINQIRGMGFNFDNAVLYELLKKENCNIASALEILLSNKK